MAMASERHVTIATVPDLKDGERRRLDLDLSHLLKARLEGEVRLDGRSLSCAGILRHGPDSRGLTTDGRGAFSTPVLPGEYRLCAWIPKDDGVPETVARMPDIIVDAETFRIGPGQRLSRTFRLRGCTLKIRAVASDGVTLGVGVARRFEPRASEAGEAEREDRVQFGRLAIAALRFEDLRRNEPQAALDLPHRQVRDGRADPRHEGA